MINTQNHELVAQKWWDVLYSDNMNYLVQTNPFTMSKARKTEWDAIYSAFNINPSHYKKIIDFGCGTGHFALNFLKKGYRITGIDLSENALDILRIRARKYVLSKHLTLIKSGLFVPIKKFHGSFDAGYMIVTYQCISRNDQKMVFKNFVELIREGGKILIMEANPLNPLFYFFYLTVYKNNLSEAGNIINSRREKLIDLLKESGLAEIKVFHHSFLPTSFINRWSLVKNINSFLCAIPVIKNFSAFNIITATKV